MKRVLAWIGIAAIVTVYIVALVFAINGGDLAIPVAMSCLLLVAYLSFYFHLGSIFVNILKGRQDKKNEKEKEEKDNK